jgi:NAD(P)H-flavin reductase
MGPYGQFRLSGNDWRPALCIAGGTGLAPMMAVLDHAAAR